MIVHDLSPDALRQMVRVDLVTATEEPESPIGQFDFHARWRHDAVSDTEGRQSTLVGPPQPLTELWSRRASRPTGHRAGAAPEPAIWDM